MSFYVAKNKYYKSDIRSARCVSPYPAHWAENRNRRHFLESDLGIR